MNKIISVEGYCVELRTNDLGHSLYSERDDLWQRLRDVVKEQMQKDVKEWKENAQYNR